MPSFTVFRGSKDGSIVKDTTNKPDLTGDQVLVKVAASGICGTDIHYRTSGMALGHEGAGVVEALGPQCVYLKVGDRVGWGYVHNSCGHCDLCLKGSEVYCDEHELYGIANFDQGSFSQAAVWRESFLFPIPDGISDEAAAPLQCGGATVFNALHAYNVQPTEVVGVIGVGGLGHLAIQFASKMGCHVVVLSSSDNKKDEAMKLGAKDFLVTKGVTSLSTTLRLKRLLITTSAQPDWNLILPIMAAEGTIHPLTVSNDNLNIPYMPLIGKGITIQASAVASRYIHKRMLAFAELHGIVPIIEKFPMTEKGIEEAMAKLDSGKMRYRGVLLPQ